MLVQQDAQMTQRGRAMLHVVETFAVTRSQSRSLNLHR